MRATAKPLVRSFGHGSCEPGWFFCSRELVGLDGVNIRSFRVLV